LELAYKTSWVRVLELDCRKRVVVLVEKELEIHMKLKVEGERDQENCGKKMTDDQS